MTLNACQQFVQTQLDNFTVSPWQPTSAFIDVPTPSVMPFLKPHIYIWGARGSEKRYAGGRQSNMPNQPSTGYKVIDHIISVWIYAVVPTTDKNRTSAFPVLIEQCKKQLRSVQLGIELLDAQTGDMSQLTFIGESFTWEYDVDNSLEDERSIRNLCLLEVDMQERMIG